MNRTVLIVAGILVIVLGILVSSAAFVVHQTEQAIVSAVRRSQTGYPESQGCILSCRSSRTWRYFDNRILDIAPPQEEIIAADQKRLVVDSFIRYRISDPLEFYKAVGSESRGTGPVGRYRQRISP